MQALTLTPLNDTKILIIGQDPYVNGDAHGLAFSSLKESVPPSLRIIFQELQRTHGGPLRKNPNLTDWAEQGVLLLNTILTAERGFTLAHEHANWEDFTGEVVRRLVARDKPLVVMLWGKKAETFYQKSTGGLNPNVSLIRTLICPHPAAQLRSGGKVSFVGCNHFVLADDWLESHATTKIKWL